MNFNSILPFKTGKDRSEVADAIGITQFPSETNWFQVMGGLIVQGGFIDNATTGTTITLNTSFPTQVLGVFLIPVRATTIEFCVDTVTADDFVLIHNAGAATDFYWFAIGV